MELCKTGYALDIQWDDMPKPGQAPRPAGGAPVRT
uniref:Uncharacterized protein n=1 Tax=Vitis vinifera TaxID=29760 RepID=F6I6P2_VITVI